MGKDLLIYGGVLFLLLAICFIPVYQVVHMTGSSGSPFGLSVPSLTADELEQTTRDDISVYSETMYLSGPWFTRDGTHIIYSASVRPEVRPAGREFGSSDWEDDLWIMDRNGSNKTRITHGKDIRKFAYDPVSGQTAFNRHRKGTDLIFILQNPAAEPVGIPGPLPHMYFSSWGPGGKQIAATGFNLSDYTGYSGLPDDRSPATGTEWSRMFIMNADGSNPREIARAVAGKFDPGTESSWSPDGKMLVFPVYSPGTSGLGVIDTGTGSVRMITKNLLQSADLYEQKNDDNPRWSPKGDLIAFIREGNVWVIRPNGSGMQMITSDGSIDTLAWNPDGTRLAFSADSYLGILDPDGKNLNRISNIRPGPLSWSPDGKALAYAPGMGVRIRITTLTPGVLKMGEFLSRQMDQFRPATTPGA
jgi:Tol biopolymer transport system component